MGYSVFPAPASGPTLAEITAAGNSAGWGATGVTTSDLLTVPNWTQISYSNTPNVSTITFSSIPTTWKKLRIVAKGIYNSLNGDYDANMRFNGDTSTNYGTFAKYQSNSGSGSYPLQPNTSNFFTSTIELKYGTASNAFSGQRGTDWDIEIDNFNTTVKTVKGSTWLRDGNGYHTYFEIYGSWKSSSATTITSITLTNQGNNFAATSGGAGIYLFGAK